MWFIEKLLQLVKPTQSSKPPTPAIQPTPPLLSQAEINRKAFLTIIAVSEGTEKIGNHGYNALFGGGTFVGYFNHPGKETYIPRLKIWTSAAGRYQIEKATFAAYKKLLNLPDFSPPSQDAIALQLIKERHALSDVDAGRIGLAVGKCSNIWASFAGNNYGQPTTALPVLLAAFKEAGGKNEDWRVA